MAERNVASPQEAWPGDLAADLAVLPWYCAQAVHAAIASSCRLWAGVFLPSAFQAHPHEPALQLEIPDPLAAAPEQDLFA